jgi:hypothetical protein
MLLVLFFSGFANSNAHASAMPQVMRNAPAYSGGAQGPHDRHAASRHTKIRKLKPANEGAGTGNIQADWLGFNDKEQINGETKPFRVVLTNISDGTTVTFSSITSDDPADYTVSMDCTTLASGQSCNAFFSFAATSVCQELLSNITINDDDPEGPVVIEVDGYGADSGLQVDDLTDAKLTATALAQSLVGQGVTVSNVTVTGSPRAIGNFTSSSNIIGFTNGIVLSTGSVRNVAGPNCSSQIDGENGFPGDTDLDNLLGADQTTNDAAILEFDFVPTSSAVSFQYVFSSDEYNEFVFQFNDVFGFFLNGTNIALIPGTQTPVAINNVNGGNPLGTGAVNPQFYINNDFQFPAVAPTDTEMDGLTVVFTAQGTVTPNTTNHIKLAIADATDFALDSNVFIKGGSFTSAAVTLVPSPVSFGSVAIGQMSEPQTVTLTNVGATTVTITSIVASTNFSETNTCPGTLATGTGTSSSCTINATFAPQAAGSLSGTLTVTYTTTGVTGPQTATATLTGTGTGSGTNETLTVTETGTGTGTVTSAPAGISCKPTCSANFASGTQITLTATPAAGSTFTGWTDATCEGTGTCTFTITAAKTVTANFGGGTTNFALTVTEAGSGTGTVMSTPAGINCKPTCSANFPGGTSVTLTAAPATGSTFTGWSAPCEGTGACTVTVSAATTVTATFNGPTGVIVTVPSGGSTTATTTPGGTAFFGLQISGGPGVTGVVQLTCASSSPLIACTVIPSTVTLNGGATEVAFGIQTFCQGNTTSTGSLPGGLGGGIGMLLAAVMFGGIGWTFKRDRRVALTFAMLMLIMVSSACGGLPKSANGATPAGTYFISLSTTLNGQTQTLPNFLTLVVK